MEDLKRICENCVHFDDEGYHTDIIGYCPVAYKDLSRYSNPCKDYKCKYGNN